MSTQGRPKRSVPADYRRELGGRVRQCRESLGLSQRELSDRTGVAADMISRLENGRFASPGLGTLLRLAEGLAVELPELLPRGLGRRAKPARHRVDILLEQADEAELLLLAEIAKAVLDRGVPRREGTRRDPSSKLRSG